MNLILTEKDDEYTAHTDDKSLMHHGRPQFYGHGKNIHEAIGHFMVANREQLGFTFQLIEKDGYTSYSTVYGEPRCVN